MSKCGLIAGTSGTFWRGVDTAGELLCDAFRHLAAGIFILCVGVTAVFMLAVIAPLAVIDWLGGEE